MNGSIIVRPAQVGDVDAIFRLLELYTASGVVLKRSKDDITGYLANFIVAEKDGSVCGCCAARDFGHDLLEVRSLVVDPACQGMGIGKTMVNSIIGRLNRERKNWRLFTLTLQVGFFRSLGFSVVEKEIFPEKIWSDCSKCPKYSRCDETALLLEKK
ncbi:MAG: N-acetyltransferase [Lentisphaerae bacterium]|nr:N-acetyltransferase [Lentisphaerota bacterium]